jgi:hypothetical protein
MADGGSARVEAELSTWKRFSGRQSTRLLFLPRGKYLAGDKILTRLNNIPSVFHVAGVVHPQPHKKTASYSLLSTLNSALSQAARPAIRRNHGHG